MNIELICPVCDCIYFDWDEDEDIFTCENCMHEVPRELNNYLNTKN